MTRKEISVKTYLPTGFRSFNIADLAEAYRHCPNAKIVNNYYYFYIEHSRPETDEEFAARTATEQAEERAEALKQFNELKQKYGFE